jgi:2-polyprenyl-3-methyl-5-hydroxy-6-metoxy-1,4-benzoquinol methylase
MPCCPLCAGVDITFHARACDIEYQTVDRSFDFYRCVGCGVLFVYPMLHDRLDVIYPANYYSFESRRRSIVGTVKEFLDRSHLRRALRDLPGDSLSALDIGGGTGWLLDLLKRADPRVSRTCVVDIDSAARFLAEAAGHQYFHGRIEEFHDGGSFDVILMLNVIEHVADPRAVLQTARRLLAPGGRLFLKTPNFDSLDARLFRHHSWGGYHTPRHFVLFNRESMVRLCGECGLKIVRFSYTQGAPFWSVSALDALRRMGMVRISPSHPAIYHPLMPLLQALFAAFDFARGPLARLSQMQFVLAGEH